MITLARRSSLATFASLLVLALFASSASATVASPIPIPRTATASTAGADFTLTKGLKLHVQGKKTRKGKRFLKPLRGKTAYIVCEGYDAANTQWWYLEGTIKIGKNANAFNAKLSVPINAFSCSVGPSSSNVQIALFRPYQPQYFTDLDKLNVALGQELTAERTVGTAINAQPTAQQVIDQLNATAGVTAPFGTWVAMAARADYALADQTGVWTDTTISRITTTLAVDGQQLAAQWLTPGLRKSK